MITNRELADTMRYLATERKTLYVSGCYGKKLTEAQKGYFIKNYAYNQKPDRQAKIKAASNDTIGGDCICIIKAIIDGWDRKSDNVDGGVKYVPAHDTTEDGLLKACGKTASDNFKKIEVGELLYNPGHCGIYIGNGFAAECTPAWKDGVQITAVLNIGSKDGYNGRTWQKHGKLPWVTWREEFYDAKAPWLAYGMVGDDVKRLQAILNCHGAKLSLDGSFGPATKEAVLKFQRTHLLDADASVGPSTWSALLG